MNETRLYSFYIFYRIALKKKPRAHIISCALYVGLIHGWAYIRGSLYMEWCERSKFDGLIDRGLYSGGGGVIFGGLR